MHDKIKIDLATGLMIDVVSPDEIGADIVETPCPDGFYLLKWDGTQWIEGKTADEIAAIKAGAKSEPTLEERVASTEAAITALMGV